MKYTAKELEINERWENNPEFDRFIDLLAGFIEKYGAEVLAEIEKEEAEKNTNTIVT